MALIKLGPEIKSIRGRFGGVYFKSGRYGQHVQRMPRSVLRPKSIGQLAGVQGYTGAAAIWLLALLGFFALAWAAFALAHYFYDKKGERKRLTGFNWYMHFSIMLPDQGGVPFWKPPHAPNELPKWVVTYKGTWTYRHTPDEWPDESPADYYWYGMMWNGKQSWRTDDFNWHIWWKDPGWVVSPSPGFEPEGLTFYSDGANVWDYYRNPITKNYIHVYVGGG